MAARHPVIARGPRLHAWLAAWLLLGIGGAGPLPIHAAAAEPPWRIESFCHRGAPPARRCLLQARQGIVVFRLGEFAAAPAIHWSDGVAVLSFAGALRFYAPPQQLSAPVAAVRAYDTRARLFVFDDGDALHLRAMFGEPRDLAVFAPPAGVRRDALQLRFADGRLQLRWRDAAGRMQEQTMRAGPGR